MEHGLRVKRYVGAPDFPALQTLIEGLVEAVRTVCSVLKP
jgi:hypothetical protein